MIIIEPPMIVTNFCFASLIGNHSITYFVKTNELEKPCTDYGLIKAQCLKGAYGF